MNLSFELDIFHESVDPVHRIGLNDLSMNLIDLVLAFSLTQWPGSPYKAIVLNVFRALTSH